MSPHAIGALGAAVSRALARHSLIVSVLASRSVQERVLATIGLATLPTCVTLGARAEPSTALEEIVVTSNKREQSIDKVDGAITAVSREELRERDVRDVTDLQKVAPSLLIGARGSRAYSNFTVRGISSPDFYNPAVQVLVDGVPQASSNLTQDLLDISRVEFLRGPQGTLYGINAFAGVINLTTEKPREGRAEVFATGSNKLQTIGTTTTSVLVPDSVFLDLAVKEQYFGGQIDDVDRHVNDIDKSNNLTGRAGLRFAPIGTRFEATVFATHAYLRSREETYILSQDVGNRALRSSLLPYPYSLLRRETTTTGVTVSDHVGDITFTNISSFQNVDLNSAFLGFDFPETYQNVYQELRAAYEGRGPLKGVFGLSFANNQFGRDAFGSHNNVNAKSAAAFGEATYALTSKIDLTAGARFAYDRSTIGFDGGPFGFDLHNVAQFTTVQPKVSLGYQLAPTTRVYALVSEGYKPGGFNHSVTTPQDGVAYRPERAWNYEIGARTGSPDGRVGLSGAVYRIESSNQQIYVGPVGLITLRNAGGGSSTGVEGEVDLRPTDRLTVKIQGTYNRSVFSNYNDPLTGQQVAGGHTPYAPNLITNISGRYLVDQHVIGAAATLTAAVRTTSRTFFDPANQFSQGPVALLDLGTELAFDARTTLRLFADNVTGRAFRTYSFAFGGNALATINQPRIFGASVTTRF